MPDETTNETERDDSESLETIEELLSDLRDLMLDIGFRVAAMTKGHSTIKAYVHKIHHPPVLNPRFLVDEDAEFLFVTVGAQNRDESTERALSKFVNTGDCVYVPRNRKYAKHYLYGAFVLPLSYVGGDESGRVDIESMRPALARIHTFVANAVIPPFT